jgi:DNA-binding response OmpR family regulator
MMRPYMQMEARTGGGGHSTKERAAWRILLVDDDASMLILLPRILRRRGFDVIVASDADSAERELEKAAVDFIVADIQLPGRDGISLAAAVRKRWPSVKIVFVSAFDADALRARAQALGPVAFFSKPIGVDELVAHLLK